MEYGGVSAMRSQTRNRFPRVKALLDKYRIRPWLIVKQVVCIAHVMQIGLSGPGRQPEQLSDPL